MNLAIFGDTETTGLPVWKEPSDGENQPHIVQLAALQVDLDTGNILQRLDVIVRPEAWGIPQETIELHGITNDLAMDVGISEPSAIDMFLEFSKGRPFIAYNTPFDKRILRIAMKRYCGDKIADEWRDQESECVMRLAKDVMGIKKNPKLVDAYQYFTRQTLVNAHSAYADVKAALRVYLEAKKGIGHETDTNIG